MKTILSQHLEQRPLVDDVEGASKKKRSQDRVKDRVVNAAPSAGQRRFRRFG
jgi:hypothetical protein